MNKIGYGQLLIGRPRFNFLHRVYIMLLAIKIDDKAEEPVLRMFRAADSIGFQSAALSLRIALRFELMSVHFD